MGLHQFQCSKVYRKHGVLCALADWGHFWVERSYVDQSTPQSETLGFHIDLSGVSSHAKHPNLMNVVFMAK
jgi:hypothetical protein